MWSGYTANGGDSGRWVNDHHGAIVTALPNFDYGAARVLPLRPIWPGFAINTIFYGAILWVLWIAPGKVRRFVRGRQHRCPACGFIIAPGTCANGLCSECGAALPWMTRASA
jgi:hypothetical protein